MTTTEFDPDSLRAKYEFERDKRLRAEGNDQYIDISDFDQYLEDPYVQPLNREPLFDEVEVAVIGGGFGGLLAGARLREAIVTQVQRATLSHISICHCSKKLGTSPSRSIQMPPKFWSTAGQLLVSLTCIPMPVCKLK